MKRFLSILAAFALVLALAGCVSGQGAKGYKLAKKEIKDRVAENDGYKFGKFTGGNFVHVKKQTLDNGSLAGIDLGETNLVEAWYFEINFTYKNDKGEEKTDTGYFYFEKGADKVSYDTLGALFATYKSAVNNGKVKGKLGTL